MDQALGVFEQPSGRCSGTGQDAGELLPCQHLGQFFEQGWTADQAHGAAVRLVDQTMGCAVPQQP